MIHKWTIQTYRIKQHTDGQVLTEQVLGQARERFGIHETTYGWSITHLKSGWAIFMSRTEDGAKIIAEYLIENYAADFERLNISGYIVKNFKSLGDRIETDTELWNLRKLFAIPQRELDRRRMEMQLKMQIVS